MGRSRSRSRSHRRRSESPDDGLTTLKVTDADAAFVRGKNGKTKDRIAKVAGCKIFISHEDLTVEIRGSAMARKKGKKYVQYVMTQRSGPVNIAPEEDDGDLTTIPIPQKACGFVTGKQGNFLRSIEEEWNTLMFFIDVDKSKKLDKKYEKLAIWGDLRGRRASELKALNAAEYMCPGFFEEIKDEVVPRERGAGECGTWGTDTVQYNDEKVSYALGKQGSTRKKIEVASGAIVQYVGKLGLFSGTKDQRKRATDYMEFLFGQLEGPIYIDNWEERNDCCVVRIPTDIIPYVTGPKRAALSSVEEKYGVFMLFMNKDKKLRDANRESEQLIIFGKERGRRGAELKMLHEIEFKKPGTVLKDLREYKSDKDGFDVDVFEVGSGDINYLIGKKGSTMKKIEVAAGCFLIYVGNYAHIGGDRKERKRCREYMDWLLKQLRGPVTVRDAKYRDDCTEVWVPKQLTGRIMGAGGSELRRIEQETNVFSFMAVDEHGDERLCIFGTDPGSESSSVGRMAAEKMVKESIARLEREGRGDSRSRSPRRSDSRARQRAPSDSRPPARRPPPGRAPARRRDDSRDRNAGRYDDDNGRGRDDPPSRAPANRRDDSRGRNAGRGDDRQGRARQDPPPAASARRRDDSRGRNAGRADDPSPDPPPRAPARRRDDSLGRNAGRGDDRQGRTRQDPPPAAPARRRDDSEEPEPPSRAPARRRDDSLGRNGGRGDDRQGRARQDPPPAAPARRRDDSRGRNAGRGDDSEKVRPSQAPSSRAAARPRDDSLGRNAGRGDERSRPDPPSRAPARRRDDSQGRNAGRGDDSRRDPPARAPARRRDDSRW